MTPSPTPIPVRGDVQIFADAGCNEYPTVGQSYSKLYARVNVPWGINGGWGVPGIIVCEGPTTEIPDDPYFIMFLVDFIGNDYSEPFAAGEVVELPVAEPEIIPEGTEFVFTKPD